MPVSIPRCKNLVLFRQLFPSLRTASQDLVESRGGDLSSHLFYQFRADEQGKFGEMSSPRRSPRLIA